VIAIQPDRVVFPRHDIRVKRFPQRDVVRSHVGDLDGTSINNGSTWTANVTITVHDNNHNLVSNATVSGTWSNGASGIAQCLTDSSGQCSVSKGSIPKRTGNVTLTVDGVTHPTLTYDPANNRDPEGDSNGTSITVSKS